MAGPQISVLIASYNHARFLDRTIQSVLQQSMTDFELLVTDDGSSDESWPVLERLAASDNRMRIFSQANRGKSATINTMAAQASAPLLCILDSDDCLLPERFAWALADLAAHPEAVATFCWAELIDAQGAPSKERPVDFFYRKALKGPLERSMLLSNRLCSATGVFRRDALEAGQDLLAPLLVYQDYDLWLRLLGRGSLHLREQVGAQYRLHDHNLSRIAHSGRETHIKEISSCLKNHAPAVMARHDTCRSMLGAVHGRLGVFAYLNQDWAEAGRHLATRAKFDRLDEEESLIFVAVLHNLGHREEAQTYLDKLAPQRDRMSARGQMQLDELLLDCQPSRRRSSARSGSAAQPSP